MLVCRLCILSAWASEENGALFADDGPSSLKAPRRDDGISCLAPLLINGFVDTEGLLDMRDGVLKLRRDVVRGRLGVDPFLLEAVDPKDLDELGLSCSTSCSDWTAPDLYDWVLYDTRDAVGGKARFPPLMICMIDARSSATSLVCFSTSCWSRLI